MWRTEWRGLEQVGRCQIRGSCNEPGEQARMALNLRGVVGTKRWIKGLQECHAMRREVQSGVAMWVLGGSVGTLTSLNECYPQVLASQCRAYKSYLHKAMNHQILQAFRPFTEVLKSPAPKDNVL